MSELLNRVKTALQRELGEYVSPSRVEAAARAAIEAMYEPADAGETAKPWPFEEGEYTSAPRPDPNGPFLLLLHDEHQKGWLWMRRYATKNDALCIAANYTGKDQVWLYEVGQELDLGRELDAFWAGIEGEQEDALSDFLRTPLTGKEIPG